MSAGLASRAEASAAAAAFLRDPIEAALAAGRRARIALSGGTSPSDCYRALAASPLDWARVDIGLVDDRFVPADHPASNEGLLRGIFESAGAAIHPLFVAGATPGEAAAAREAAYVALRPFDAILLGLGPDGHSASWFPGAAGTDEALDRSNPLTLAAIDATGSPVAGDQPHRLTLTLGAVAECAAVGLLCFGADKRAVWDAGWSSPVYGGGGGRRPTEGGHAAGVASPLSQASPDSSPVNGGARALPIAAVRAALGDRLTLFWAP
jgi:6-phosphogluconolactonase